MVEKYDNATIQESSIVGSAWSLDWESGEIHDHNGSHITTVSGSFGPEVVKDAMLYDIQQSMASSNVTRAITVAMLMAGEQIAMENV